MHSLRTHFRSGLALMFGVATVLALLGCGSSQAALPPFPDYPPAKVYLEDQEMRREQVLAIQAHEAQVRLINQIRATQRANAMWLRTEAQRAERERELAFRESIRRMNEARHFRDLQEFQALQ